MAKPTTIQNDKLCEIRDIIDEHLVHSDSRFDEIQLSRVKYWNANDKHHSLLDEKLNKLMVLVELVEPLQIIVQAEKDKQAVSSWMAKAGKGIGFIAVVITSTGVIISAAWLVIETIIRSKN